LNTGGGIVDVANSGTSLFLQNQVSGVGSLTKTGAGVLILNNTNFYQGGTTIAGGILSGNTIANQGSNSAFGQGNFVIDNGATLQYTGGTASTNRTISLGSGGGTVAVTGTGNRLAVTGVVSGTGGLTKTGLGTLQLINSNTYSGGTIINNGEVDAFNTSGSATGSGDVTINAGALFIGFGGTAGAVSGNITNFGFVRFNRSDNTTYAGQISGTGSMEKNGAGTLELTGANT
jgi:autotransporter-associated beta strand protein